MPFFCAVPTNLAHDPNGVLAPAVGRPVLHRGSCAEQVDHDQEEPELQGQAPAQRERRSSTTSATRSPRRTCALSRARRTTPPSGIPPASYAEAAQKYGVNKGQFWVKPQLGVSNYLAFNHDRPLFKGAPGAATSLKAINYAIDRKAMLAQGGYLAGKRTDQILPPGIAGFRDANLYPLKGPDIATAKKWAAKAGLKSGTSVQLYTSNTGAAPLRAQILPVQPEADRPEGGHASVRAWRADRQGRHSW